MNIHKHIAYILASSILFFFSNNFKSQARLKTAFMGKLTIGALINPVENFGEEKWSIGLGSVINLEPSIKFRWKNSFSLALGGGINLNNYDFRTPGFKYIISYYGFKTESILTKYFYLGNTFEYLAIGCGAGYKFHSNNELIKEEEDFKVVANSHKSRPLFISPQIGTYKRDDRFSYSLMLQYTHVFINQPYITFDLSSDNSTATSSHKGSYLGLNLIVDYDLKKKAKTTPIEWEKELPENYLSRNKEKQGFLDCSRHKATIWVWDYGIVDNDSISFVLNDKVVLSKHKITHTKKKIKVRLESGENQLKMVAHNEGNVKPNSAALEIRSGFKKKSFVLNSTLNSTAIINLNYLYIE